MAGRRSPFKKSDFIKRLLKKVVLIVGFLDFVIAVTKELHIAIMTKSTRQKPIKINFHLKMSFCSLAFVSELSDKSRTADSADSEFINQNYY